MTEQPIIDHWGAYVTEPNKEDVVWWISGYPDWRAVSLCWYSLTAPFSLFNGDLYATREAAEHALTRVKCLRRLKEMAYGDGWLPSHLNAGYHPAPKEWANYILYLPVQFYTAKQAREAAESLTPAERAAFLYVYKPVKGKK